MGCGAARFTIGPTVAHPASSSTAHPDPIAAATGAVPGAPAATTDPLDRAEVHPEKDAPVSVSVCDSTDMEKGVENEVGVTTEQLGNNLAALPNDARRRSAGMPIDWGTKADTSAEADFVSTEYGSSPVEQEPLETEMAGLPNDACTQSRDLPTDVEPVAKIEDDRRVAACSSTEDSRGYNHSDFLAKLSGTAATVSATPVAHSEIRQPDVKVEEDGRKSPTVEELMNEIAPADEQLEKELRALQKVSRMRSAIMPENVDLVQDAPINRQDSPSVDDLVAEVASIPR